MTEDSSGETPYTTDAEDMGDDDDDNDDDDESDEDESEDDDEDESRPTSTGRLRIKYICTTVPILDKITYVKDRLF